MIGFLRRLNSNASDVSILFLKSGLITGGASISLEKYGKIYDSSKNGACISESAACFLRIVVLGRLKRHGTYFKQTWTVQGAAPQAASGFITWRWLVVTACLLIKHKLSTLVPHFYVMKFVKLYINYWWYVRQMMIPSRRLKREK